MSMLPDGEPLAPVLAAAPAADGEFVEITDADVDQVVELWKTCGLTRPWNDPYVDIADARASGGSTVLVARAEGRVAATAMAGHDGHRGWLYYMVRTTNTDVLDFYARMGYTDQECTVLGRWVESD